MRVAVVSRRDSQQHREQYLELEGHAELSFFADLAAENRPEWPTPDASLVERLGGPAQSLSHLSRLAANRSYDCIVVHGLHRGSQVEVTRRVCEETGLPALARIDTNGHARSAFQAAFDRTAVRYQARYVSGALAIGSSNEAYLTTVGVNSSHTTLWPWKPNLDRFLNAIPESGNEYVLLAGRLESEKGHELALRSVALIPSSRRPPIRVAGSGSLLHRLRLVAKELQLECEFLGSVDRNVLAVEMASAKCLLLTSEREAWALVANEALAAGCPVVATPSVGAARDLIRDRVAGRVTHSRNAASIAFAIESLLSDSDLHSNNAREGRRDIVTSWQRTGSPIDLVDFIGGVVS